MRAWAAQLQPADATAGYVFEQFGRAVLNYHPSLLQVSQGSCYIVSD